MKTLKIRWMAEYESELFVDDDADNDDAAYDVDIPENDESKYVDMTYKVLSIEEC